MPNNVSLSRIVEAASQEATGSKTTSYTLTTLAAGLIYALISLLLFLFTPPSLQILLWIALPVVYALTFSPIRYALEELIRQVFPGTDYNSHALIKNLNTISYSTLTINKLTERFFSSFEAKFDAPYMAFVISGHHPEIITSPRFQRVRSIPTNYLSKLCSSPPENISKTSQLKSHHLRHSFDKHRIKLIVPLITNQQVHGLLLLGPKGGNSRYTTKDYKVLSAIAPKIGYAILNAQEYEKVEAKNKKLIKDLEDANERLTKFNQQLKHDARLKDEFLYIATHELKNPVTAMKGYLSLISEGDYGKVPTKIKEAVESINSSNQQLISLLNNLLQIARSEAEKIEIVTEPIVICDVIEEVVHDVQPLLKQKDLKVDHACPNRSVTVMADKERLREIISNLISNAIKYSEKGTISITHEIIKDQLATHVKDEGVGISKKDQKKIFTRFFRVEEEAAKGIPGTGLGLFIIKDLVEKMRGQIWFESQAGEGSIFSFSLPLARTYSLKSK